MIVDPLVCEFVPILTVAFSETINVATNCLRSVPYGTIAVMVASVMVAITTGVNPAKLNDVIAFSEDFNLFTVILTLDLGLIHPFSV